MGADSWVGVRLICGGTVPLTRYGTHVIRLWQAQIAGFKESSAQLRMLEENQDETITSILDNTFRRGSGTDRKNGATKLTPVLLRMLACGSQSKMLRNTARDILSTKAFAGNLGFLQQ